MATLIEKVKSNNWFASGFGLVLLSLGSIDQYYSPTDHVSSLFVSLILGFMMIIFTVWKSLPEDLKGEITGDMK